MTLPLWMWAIGGAGLGAIIGSFLATLVVRWPAGRNLGGRSACDGCGRSLTAAELVPVLSALVVRGRCRTCGARIAGEHPAVEVGAALIGGLACGLAPGWSGAAWAVFGWLLLTLAMLDLRHFWLPDRLTGPLAGLGLAIGGVASGATVAARVIGAVAGFGALWLIGWSYRRLRGRDGLGGGDPKLLAGIGAWLGWAALPFVVLAASVVGLLAALCSGGLRPDRAVPFGVALAAGALPGWLLFRFLVG